MDDAEVEQAVVLECIECGHSEYQPLIVSFWRKIRRLRIARKDAASIFWGRGVNQVCSLTWQV